MTSFKLYYTNARGRAELIRWILAVADQPYEDVRLEKDQWQEMKPKTPFGVMPLLEVDGKLYCQSQGIARYLAKRFDLVGSNDDENLQADMVAGCIEDFMQPIIRFAFTEQDTVKKAELYKKFTDEQLPSFLGYFEEMLKGNSGGNSHFIGSKLSWVDLAFVQFLEFLPIVKIKVDYSKYPTVQTLKSKVEGLPAIEAWLEKRPKTEH